MRIILIVFVILSLPCVAHAGLGKWLAYLLKEAQPITKPSIQCAAMIETAIRFGAESDMGHKQYERIPPQYELVKPISRMNHGVGLQTLRRIRKRVESLKTSAADSTPIGIAPLWLGSDKSVSPHERDYMLDRLSTLESKIQRYVETVRHHFWYYSGFRIVGEQDIGSFLYEASQELSRITTVSNGMQRYYPEPDIPLETSFPLINLLNQLYERANNGDGDEWIHLSLSSSQSDEDKNERVPRGFSKAVETLNPTLVLDRFTSVDLHLEFIGAPGVEGNLPALTVFTIRQSPYVAGY